MGKEHWSVKAAGKGRYQCKAGNAVQDEDNWGWCDRI